MLFRSIIRTTNEEVFVPPKKVASAARIGLLLRKTYGRGGTLVGIKRAHQLANRDHVSFTTIKRMDKFFKRHRKNKMTPPEKGNGFIAWMLWGGDPGMKWAKSIIRKYQNQKS